MSEERLVCWKCPERFRAVEALAQHAAKKHGVDPMAAMDRALEIEEAADAMTEARAPETVGQRSRVTARAAEPSNKVGRPGNPSFDVAEALRLRKSDPPMSIKKIAHKLGVGVPRIVAALAGASGGAPRKPVDMVKVDRELAAGKTQGQVARGQGVDRNTIGRRLRERGAAGMNVVEVLRAKRARLAMLEEETAALREELAEVARLLATE